MGVHIQQAVRRLTHGSQLLRSMAVSSNVQTPVCGVLIGADVRGADTVAMPNYTGSIGFGEKYVRKLMGQIGTLDVEDCMASVRHLVATGVSSDGPGRQLLYGGSHGGFLLGHRKLNRLSHLSSSSSKRSHSGWSVSRYLQRCRSQESRRLNGRDLHFRYPRLVL